VDLVEARARGFDAGTRHPWERARVELAIRLLERHVTLGPGAAVLDIGCGDTFVVEELARRYPHARFCAVDSGFTEELIETYRRRLAVGNVSLFSRLDAVPLSQPASLVLLMDVVEHIADDRGFLYELRDQPWIGHDTRWLFTVPAYQWLYSEHDRFLGHHRRYSLHGLHGLLSAARLAPLESGYWFTSLLAVRALQVARERLRGRTNATTTDLAAWRSDELTTRRLTRILTLDGSLGLRLSALGVGLSVPGLSCFAICRKSN
jgi:hypothetical protein